MFCSRRREGERQARRPPNLEFRKNQGLRKGMKVPNINNDNLNHSESNFLTLMFQGC
jgi:hypothetical protein